MFDFGWQEFMMIAFVLVLVVGPKDLPKVLRSFSKITGQARSVAREFTKSLEEVASEADVKDVKQMVTDIKSGNLEDMARIVDDEIVPDVKSASDAADLSSIKKDIQSVQDSSKIIRQNQSEAISTSVTPEVVKTPLSPSKQDKA